jgi:hypothetical protein
MPKFQITRSNGKIITSGGGAIQYTPPAPPIVPFYDYEAAVESKSKAQLEADGWVFTSDSSGGGAGVGGWNIGSGGIYNELSVAGSESFDVANATAEFTLLGIDTKSYSIDVTYYTVPPSAELNISDASTTYLQSTEDGVTSDTLTGTISGNVITFALNISDVAPTPGTTYMQITKVYII